MRRAVWLFFTAASIMLLAIWGCHKGAPITIKSISATPATVAPGGSSTISAIVDYEGEGTVTYNWSCDDGTISGEGNSITWTAPSEIGNYTVTLVAGDGDVSDEDSVIVTVKKGATPGVGYITFGLADSGEKVYRIEAREGATLENVSLVLGAISLSGTGEDAKLNISPNGQWYVLETDRFDPACQGWPGLAVVAGDLSSGETVHANGEVVHIEGFPAIASDGNLIVYPAGDGPHEQDLWVITRKSGTDWSTPVLLTGSSPYKYSDQPAISADGSKVVFDGGNEPYAGEGTAICEVGTDGSGFRVVIKPEDGPGGTNNNVLHHPDYAPDGSIVFEADWGENEQIWRLPVGETEPVKITDAYDNDNSPCVLTDGRIVSLWTVRPGGEGGIHDIKVMKSDGSSHFMVLTDIDVEDAGIGCGQ